MIQETYKGVRIGYSEPEDQWRITDETTGIDGKYPTLRAAKEAVDKATKAKKKPVEAWTDERVAGLVRRLTKVRIQKGGPRPERLFVTYLEPNESRWTQREQVDVSWVYADSEANRARIAELNAIADHIENLKEEHQAKMKSLELAWPAEEKEST